MIFFHVKKKLYFCTLKMFIHELTYHPKQSDFSKVTFWDTDFFHIDWKRHACFVIERFFGYGTEQEQQIVVKMYGEEVVREFERSFMPSDFNRNVKTNLGKMMSHAAL